MNEKKETIGRAHDVATTLEAEGWSQVEVGMILAMALGIYAEGREDSHRNLQPLFMAHFEVAQKTFDALRAGRNREPGHA